tara:strand:- start:1082 stop:2209 length:1128 start_codon:yes stop_codon:yes gene_type:complete
MPTKKISELDERLTLQPDPHNFQVPYSASTAPTGNKDSEALFIIARSGVTNEKINYRNFKSSTLDNVLYLTGNQLVSGSKVFADTTTFLDTIFINHIVDVTFDGDISGNIFTAESGLFQKIGIGDPYFFRTKDPQNAFEVSGDSLFIGDVTITGDVYQDGNLDVQGDSSHLGNAYLTGQVNLTGEAYLENLKIWDGIEFVDIPGEDDETMIFKTRLFAGQDSYQIDFPKDFLEVPIIFSSIQNDNGGAVIPFQTSDVTRYNYQINFGTAIPDNHYSVHTAVMSTGEKARNKIGIQRFTTNLSAGQSSYKIDFPSTFAGTPVVTPTIDGGNTIVPFSISGVSSAHYFISFTSTTTQDYKVNTISTLPGRKHLAKGD